ncbi:MAG: hypothetical protein CTY35_00630 [Methylotenera sp.]|uniref:hypothetical protein n=1 Tax=Methylotenera sp. TaxID=2051956 RepID=UPI000D43DDB8|nr:hypothetical protein [Methylotenera sp.]PPC84859.1 MAG: hypothetical protein CTY38_00625 [Methylotenera sp.]PPD02219.1 MAG: hypothetical protein CTY35_00630 [Methylotenera sp.]
MDKELKITHSFQKEMIEPDYRDTIVMTAEAHFDREGINIALKPEGFEHPVEVYISVIKGVPTISFYNDQNGDRLGSVALSIRNGIEVDIERNQAADQSICEEEVEFLKNKQAEHTAKMLSKSVSETSGKRLKL